MLNKFGSYVIHYDKDQAQGFPWMVVVTNSIGCAGKFKTKGEAVKCLMEIGELLYINKTQTEHERNSNAQ